MIRFFRNIRKKLVSENKVMAYLRYAIGEIILVVIGILIALQINNWNETRKQDITETEFIEGVKNDLAQDRKYMELILNLIEPKIEAYNLLNNYIANITKPDKNYTDSLLQEYFFVGQRTFYPISGSFQSAIAGNEINTYKNKELIRTLIKLYNSTYPRLIDNANMLDDRWTLLSEKYIHERRTKHFNKMDNAQLSKVLDDIYFHLIQLQWYQNVLANTIAEIDELLKKINNEIL
ncbi:MAG: hypothetical protein IPM56_17275 [Ignavibacteriales bacterium]|nr:MAG: hypothetical protein IPM56_17275 [Ignavibacteriales bacterium]